MIIILCNKLIKKNDLLTSLNNENILTKTFLPISETNLEVALIRMQQKHPNENWVIKNNRKEICQISTEGVEWIKNVYFSHCKISFIDKEILFFYNKTLYLQNWLKNHQISTSNFENSISNMSKKELLSFLNRSESTLKRAVSEMKKNSELDYKNYMDNKVYFSSEQIIWLLKNKFKYKYLELLENYKLELEQIKNEKEEGINEK